MKRPPGRRETRKPARPEAALARESQARRLHFFAIAQCQLFRQTILLIAGALLIKISTMTAQNPLARPWTDSEDAILGTDMYPWKIATKLNRTESQIRKRILLLDKQRRLGIDRHSNTIGRPWTDSEDAILGTDTLAKVSDQLKRPVSQIQERMTLLGVPHFGQTRRRGRSPAVVAKEQAQADRNKARFGRQMQGGMAVAAMIATGQSVRAAAQELGIDTETARQRLLKFVRLIGYPARFGAVIPPDWRAIEASLLNEAVRRAGIELETGALDVWREHLIG